MSFFDRFGELLPEARINFLSFFGQESQHKIISLEKLFKILNEKQLGEIIQERAKSQSKNQTKKLKEHQNPKKKRADAGRMGIGLESKEVLFSLEFLCSPDKSSVLTDLDRFILLEWYNNPEK